MPDPASLGTHFASLNLFRERDGTFRITVAGMTQEAFDYARARGVKPPVDVLAAPISEAAEHFARDHLQRHG